MYIARVACVAVLGLGASGLGLCAEPAAVSEGPIHIPLTVTKNPEFGVYKTTIDIGIGNLKPLTIGFDTGSTGLHVWADANLDALDNRVSGINCTNERTSVTYGNPARITFHGVVCHAKLHFQGFVTPKPVPIAYLTSYTCPKDNPGCSADLDNPKAMHGYGVFGAGLTGQMFTDGQVPNPILTLPGNLGSTYSITLTDTTGELVLGAQEPPGAVEFHLTQNETTEGVKWTLGNTCLFVDGMAIDKCLLISFDTGNGVPWIHTADPQGIPVVSGLVKAGTSIGFAPPGSPTEALSVLAGTSFADSIKVRDSSRALTNVSIQVFLDHVVTYDNTRGVISFAPLNGIGSSN